MLLLTLKTHAQVAPRRTVAFVRVVFVFAIIWSFGALLHPDSRDVFDTWLRERVEKARLLRFPYNEQEDYKHGLWVIYVASEACSFCLCDRDLQMHMVPDLIKSHVAGNLCFVQQHVLEGILGNR